MAEFDLKNELEQYPCSDMLKAGFLFHIEKKNIKINSKKEFEKKLEEYQSLKIGG